MTLVFKHSKHEVGQVYSFFFEPQAPVAFTAGQSIKIALPGEFDSLERRFSISAAPSEKLIRITTKVHGGDFKQALSHLKPGAPVHGFAIEGTFLWRESKLPKVFIAAGIGITPYRSMLAERVAQKLPLDVTLIYGTSDDLIFRDELDKWQQEHAEFTVHYEIGHRLDGAFISQHCDVKNSLLFVSGPTQMVDDLGESLLHHGAKKENIVLDWFTGKLQY